MRPIFAEGRAPRSAEMPSASPDELAIAIIECVGARARVINLSVAVVSSPTKTKRTQRSRKHSITRLARGVIVVTAAGQSGNRGRFAGRAASVGDPRRRLRSRRAAADESNLGN